MNVSYEHKEPFTLIGFSTFIRPEEGYIKCPEFWDWEYNARYARLWQTKKPETPQEAAILDNGIGMLALCTEAEGGFEYMIAGHYRGGKVPQGFKLFSLPESDWAIFSAKGPLPGSLQSLNTQVWQEWFPSEGQRLHADGRTTLETYSAGNPASPDYECGIWVPIGRIS